MPGRRSLFLKFPTRGEVGKAQMSGKLLFLHFARGLFCLPKEVNPGVCFVYRVMDDALQSLGLQNGAFAVCSPYPEGEIFRDGDIALVVIAGLRLIKRVFAAANGALIIGDDTGVYAPVQPGTARVEGRVLHACTGYPENCSGWMLSARRLLPQSFTEAFAEGKGLRYSADAATGRILKPNPQWREMTGQSLRDACRASWPWLELIHPDDAPRIAEGWRHSLEKGVINQSTLRVRKINGDYQRIMNMAVPVFDAKGKIIRWDGAYQLAS